jgi:hypothetical protein
MPWPINPVNGSTTTIGGVIYVYNSSKNAWGPATTANVTQISYTGNVVAANVIATGNLYVNNTIVPTITQLLTYNLAL